MYHKWTSGDIALIRELAGKEDARYIAKRIGVSCQSVRHVASRNGISLYVGKIKTSICPSCGSEIPSEKVTYEGICRACVRRRKNEILIERKAELERYKKLKEAEEQDFNNEKKKSNVLHQQNHRLRKFCEME